MPILEPAKIYTALNGESADQTNNDAGSEPIQALTVEAWVTRERTGHKETVVSKWTDAAEGQSWLLYIDTDDRPCFAVRDSRRNEVVVVKAKVQLQTLYRPYHLAGVFDTQPDSGRYVHQILVDGEVSSWRWVSQQEDTNWRLGAAAAADSSDLHLHHSGEAASITVGDTLRLGDEEVTVQSEPGLLYDYGYADYTVAVDRAVNDTQAGDHAEQTVVYRLTPDSTGIVATSTETTVGRTASDQDDFQGSIDEARVWSVARTAAEIKESIDQARLRAVDNLLALYTFQEGGGDTVNDVSGVGSPLDLTVDDEVGLNWETAGGVQVSASTRLATPGPAAKVIQAVRAANEVTVEAWIVPPETAPDSLARMMALSAGPNRGNLTLGQYQSAYQVRLRTDATNPAGSDQPLHTTVAVEELNQLTHLIYTRSYDALSSDGQARYYLNGREVERRWVAGALSNWESDFKLTLGNDPTGGETHAWLGTFHLAAIYDRALTPVEVQRNYEVGADTNLAPLVDAGPDQTVNLEIEPDERHTVTVALAGQVVDDRPASAEFTVAWSKVSGPDVADPEDDVQFDDAAALETTAVFATGGVYVLRLTVYDGDPEAGETRQGSDEVTITVNPNRRPQAAITAPEPETVVTLPNDVALEAVVMDDGLPTSPGRLTLAWTQLESGPGALTVFNPPDLEVSRAKFSKPGRYVLQLTAADGHLDGRDQVALQVYGPPVIRLLATRLVVNLPDTATLQGEISDDGLGGQSGSVTVHWEGLTGVDPDPADALETTAVFSDKGVYGFRLTVDNGRLPAVSQEATVTVNKTPVIDAGSDETLSPPPPHRLVLTGQIIDDGRGDSDAEAVRVLWETVSRPAGGNVNFEDPEAPDTTVYFSAKGDYILRFTVDNGYLSASDEIKVEVRPGQGPPRDEEEEGDRGRGRNR